jgi:streptogramin lyase
MLTGCNLLPRAQAYASGVQKHTFSGKLNLLSVPTPYSLPGQIVLGPDGNLWFPAVAYENFTTHKPSGAIGQLTQDGKFHMFPLPAPYTYPLSVAFGRDGKLWFSAFQGNGKLAPNIDQAPRFTSGHSELGQMSQNGTFHLFTLPSSTISPGSITVGTDGNLWFTDVSSVGAGNVNKIGRVTPSGVFTEFPLTLRKATDFISHIIAGPDGNIWFSIESYLPDYSAFGEMGRITSQGVVTIFDLGKFTVPGDMTVGPDNNIWFSAGSLIGRITMKGQVNLFDPEPKAQSSNRIGIGGITSNSDGALWFATVNAEVGRITTNGSFKFYPFPPNTSFDNGVSTLDMSNLRGIVAGSDGTLWLTNDAQIGHFV